jgi:hypothetical protein
MQCLLTGRTFLLHRRASQKLFSAACGSKFSWMFGEKAASSRRLRGLQSNFWEALHCIVALQVPTFLVGRVGAAYFALVT